jgi:hypothetical protein
MFNLIMGYAAPTEMQAARMFEYTDDEVKKFIAPGPTWATFLASEW